MSKRVFKHTHTHTHIHTYVSSATEALGLRRVSYAIFPFYFFIFLLFSSCASVSARVSRRIGDKGRECEGIRERTRREIEGKSREGLVGFLRVGSNSIKGWCLTQLSFFRWQFCEEERRTADVRGYKTYKVIGLEQKKTTYLRVYSYALLILSSPLRTAEGLASRKINLFG